MTNSVSTIEPPFPRRMTPLFVAQALVTLGTAFLQMGFFFYASDQWGWTPRRNLLLACAQGCAYACGALSASSFARRFGRRNSIIVLPLIFCAVAVICAFYRMEPAVVAPLLVVLCYFIAAYWPGLESLVATGADATSMAHRLAMYNLLWPFIGAGGTAVCGLVIAHLPTGFFLISAGFNALAGITIWVGGPQPEEHDNSQTAIDPSGEEISLADRPIAEVGNDASLHAEPALLHERTLALWLSRIALPSTYLVSYALAAIMPTLPAIAGQKIAVQTVIGSIWLVGRWIAFSILALSTFWHTRPRLLIVASLIMLIAFAGICVPVWPGGGIGELIIMSIAQMVLGFALALIYSASLYFGMVLSEGSTEHGGYHEALIGLGQALGPGVAAIAQIIHPGSVIPAVIAISGMLTLSLLASLVAMARLRAPE